jgi:signal transduction histidine kinase
VNLKPVREWAGLVLLGGSLLTAAVAWQVSPLPDNGLVGLLACAVILFIWRSDRLARHLGGVEHKMERLLAEQRAERRAREEAEEAVRVRDEALSVASHELRSPITSLRGYVQWLPRQLERDGAVDVQRLHNALRVIDQQSDKLTRLIGQLLDTSRAETGKLELEMAMLDVGALVRSVATVFQDTTRRAVTVEAPAWPVLTVGDSLRLEQVLLNLLDNASKFDQSGMPIEVTVDGPAGGRVTFSVRDHGAGVPVEDRARIFAPYAQTESGRRAGGMGLGLYICRQIVAKHGGTIEVEAPPGAGARFAVTLRSLADAVERDMDRSLADQTTVQRMVRPAPRGTDSPVERDSGVRPPQRAQRPHGSFGAGAGRPIVLTPGATASASLRGRAGAPHIGA